MKNNVKDTVKNYTITTLGCAILAFAINYFYLANKLAEGGVAGIALIIHYLTGLDLSYLYFILNIPLIIIGYKFIGKDFIAKTLYATLSLTVFLKLFQNFQGQMEDILVASIFAGALGGLGMGILFMAGGSSGGTDIIAKIINKYMGIPISKVVLGIDLIILSFVAVIFGKNIFMYTLIALTVSSKMIDIIQEGLTSAKGVTIITNCPDAMKERIMEEVGRGVTIISGRGGFSNKDLDIIYCIVGKYQLIKVKNIVREMDKNAFMTVSYVHEVIGEGFGEH